MKQRRLTKLQREMLEDANAASMPGDGIPIRGSGAFRSAVSLAKRGFATLTRFRWGGGVVEVTWAGRTHLKEHAKK